MILVLFSLDYILKTLALNNLEVGQSINFLPFVDLLLIFNSGVAFGFLDYGTTTSSLTLLLITILITIFLFRLLHQEKSKIAKIGLALIISGAIGNSFDRFLDYQVTDFLHLHSMQFSFFVFNPADAYITVGALLLIYFEIKKNVSLK
jgi:signal peptidase II